MVSGKRKAIETMSENNGGEGMTDTNEDRFKKIKNKPRNYEIRENVGWMTMEREELLDLIQEVERLHGSNMVKEVAIEEYAKARASLTKELEQCKKDLDIANGASANSYKRATGLINTLNEVRIKNKKLE